MGPEALLELDQELILTLTCPVCKTVEGVIKPISSVSFESAHCPTCETFRETMMTHAITGEEAFTHRTLASIGVPPLHILRAHNAQEYRFYELTGDVQEALHFNHFDGPHPNYEVIMPSRIQMGDEVKLAENPGNPAHGRVRIND